MVIYFDNNFPKNLAEALRLLHGLDDSKVVEVVRTQNIENINKEDSVLFLFDNSKRGLDIAVDKHFEKGFRVFAFKLKSCENYNLFQLTLVTLKLWSQIFNIIIEESSPFVYTYNYKGKSLTRARLGNTNQVNEPKEEYGGLLNLESTIN